MDKIFLQRQNQNLIRSINIKIKMVVRMMDQTLEIIHLKNLKINIRTIVKKKLLDE